jgi:hypothetical protein
MATARTPPWRKPKPKSAKRPVHLTTTQIAAARRRAKEAGRRYPNLVDNMWAARYARDGRVPPAKKTRRARKTVAKKTSGPATATRTPRKKTTRARKSAS